MILISILVALGRLVSLCRLSIAAHTPHRHAWRQPQHRPQTLRLLLVARQYLLPVRPLSNHL